jgi:carbon-monoxide dehydrogenase medium subunit
VKPVNFEYVRPKDIQEAVALIADDSRSAKILAGGQSLGPMLNMRLVQPDLIVDITRIEELKQVREEDDCVIVGACVTHADFEDRRVPDVTHGALPSVASGIAYRAVRNRGTIGGSLTHADPSADWISILSAIGASVTLAGPSGSSRTVPVEAYMLGALEADIRPGEILVAVTIPRLGRGARWGYYKSCRKTGEFAHAIGAFLADPERSVSRAVIGATEGRPIVVADARKIIGDGTKAALEVAFDATAAVRAVEAGGLNDPIERQTHVVALRRAIERAHPA